MCVCVCSMLTDAFLSNFYSGDHDMCVPYTGSEAWTRSVGFKIVDEWRPWTSNGQIAGYLIPLPFILFFSPSKFLEVIQRRMLFNQWLSMIY